jgi:hypothetical protein
MFVGFNYSNFFLTETGSAKKIGGKKQKTDNLKPRIDKKTV